MDRWKEEMEALVKELPGSAREIWDEAFREALLEVQGDSSRAADLAWRAFRKPENEGHRRAGRKTAAQGMLMVAVRGGTPEWVRVLGSDGLVLKEGRYPCCVNRRSLQAVAERWEERGRVLRIALTELRREAGSDLAAGWIQELKHRQDGLWIRVEWTERALADIWRQGPAYLGLNFILDKDQKPVELRQAYLSCYPLINLWPASNQGDPVGERDGSLDDCLGQRPGQVGNSKAEENEGMGHEDEDGRGAMMKKLMDLEGVLGEIQESCRLAGDVSRAEVRQAVERAGPGQPGQAGPRPPEDKTRVDDSVDTAMEKRIGEAVARGWIKPEQRDWARVYASRDWQGFEEFLDLAAGALGMKRRWPWRWLWFWRRFF